MRSSLFLSALFTLTLAGGAAYADKPERPVRDAHMPHTVDVSRWHGDQVDKSYRYAREGSSASASQSVTASQASSERAGRLPTLVHGRDRINCSDTGADCTHSRTSARTITTATPSDEAASNQRAASNPLSKRADQRVNCNEGEECSMSSRGARSVWAKWRNGPATTKTDQGQSQSSRGTDDRGEQKSSSARMSCNEGEECSFSSQAAARIWRTESFKHGTVKGSRLQSELDAQKAAASAAAGKAATRPSSWEAWKKQHDADAAKTQVQRVEHQNDHDH